MVCAAPELGMRSLIVFGTLCEGRPYHPVWKLNIVGISVWCCGKVDITKV